jgi:hypothetical protein
MNNKQFRNLLLALCLLVVMAPLAHSKKLVFGEGRFFAHEDDSIEFIKEQLFFSSVENIITKELENMGLSSTIFWEKYDEKFEEYFEPIKEKLKVKFQQNEEANELVKTAKKKAKLKDAYKKNLRKKRLKNRYRFVRIKKVIKSFSIKKKSVSAHISNARYIKISARTNRKFLNSLYQSVVEINEKRSYDTLYLSVNINLKNTDWSRLGVEIKSDFVNVLKKHWKVEFEKIFSNLANQVILTDEKIEDSLKKFQILDTGTHQSLSMDSEGNQKSFPFGGNFTDSLWASIDFGILESGEDKFLKKRKFALEGGVTFVDLGTDRILGHGDFNEEQLEFSFAKEEELSSNIAGAVFRRPLLVLNRIKKKIVASSYKEEHLTLSLNNLRSMKEVLNFIEILKSKGVTLKFGPMLQSYDVKSAKISLRFTGELDRAFSVLKKISGSKFSPGRNILLMPGDENTNRPTSFIMGDVASAMDAQSPPKESL